MKRFHKIIAGALSVAVIATMFTACGEKKETDSGNKLTYWMSMDGNVSSQFSSFGDTAIAQELEKRTGTDIEYIHPAGGNATEKFSIMIAMKELPDLIEYNWNTYPGGPDKAMDDNRIIDISQYLDYAPNFKKYIEENEEIAKLIKTDDGRIIGFPMIEGDGSLGTSAGIALRKDWLDDLGLEVPTTISEWEVVLKAFKEKKGATAPLTMIPWSQLSYGPFVGAYGVIADYYVEDGIVKYGPAEQGFKEFLKLANKWYNEGLLDSAVASQGWAGMDANLLSGASGAIIGSLGGGMGKWMAAATEPGFDLVGAPYPTLNKGEKPKFGHKVLRVPGNFVCISTSCKDIELAMKYLDYGYSEEGHMLYNFGIEGESYNMVDGKPVYTELITDNPEGKSMSEAMAKYMRAQAGGPFVQDVEYMNQYAKLPQQKQAWKTWADTDAEKYILPQLYIENTDKFAKDKTAINTYYQEMVLKFMVGIEPIENFDKYVEELNKRGLKDVLDEQQRAYERYLKR